MQSLNSTADWPVHTRQAASIQSVARVGSLRLRQAIGSLNLRQACSTPMPILLHAAAGMTAVAALMPGRAWAHVKWFAPYDVAQAPVPIRGVMTTHFLLVLAGFASLMFGGFLLDRLAARYGPWATGSKRRTDLEERVLRAGIGAAFMALFTMGGIILTPELHTDASWPAWLQFGIAASMLSARTCVLGGLGILLLYGFGIAQYGIFHLSDYPMFLGIAAYLALTSSASERLRSLRMPVLYATVCVSLMWAAIEKWAYPQWSFPLLEARPYLTLGLPPGDFMVVAGFVEFALAFYILTGLGLLRLGIFGLGLIFVSAILDFGRLDAIGHLPTIACLAAMFVHGPTPLHRWLHDARRGLLAEAGKAGLSFATAISVFFVAYYGMQHAEYRNGDAREHAALVFQAKVQVQ